MPVQTLRSAFRTYCKKLREYAEEPSSLSTDQRHVLQELERRMLPDLKDLYERHIISSVWFLDWFLTEEGREAIQHHFEEDIPNTRDGLRAFLYTHQDQIRNNIPGKQRKQLANDSWKFVQKDVKEYLISCVNSHGDMVRPQRAAPERITIILDLEGLCENLRIADELLERLDVIEKDLNREVGEDVPEGFIEDMVAMYRERVRELQLSYYVSGYPIAEKERVVGLKHLSNEEHHVFDWIPFQPRIRSWDAWAGEQDDIRYGSELAHLLGYDFSFGVEALAEYADEHTEERKQYCYEAYNRTKQQTYSAFKVKSWADDLLNRYEFLSEHTEYQEDRAGPPPDDKWQVVLTSTSHFRVIPKQKVVTFPKGEDMSLKRALPVALGHELEGHVLQHENKTEVIPGLFQYVGGARRMLLAEGGAKAVEEEVFRQKFGLFPPPEPDYVAAIQERLRGGGFLECVRATYQAHIAGYQELKREGKLTEDDLERVISSQMQRSISKARRVFRDGTMQRNDGYVTNSKDLVYLEQDLVREVLAEYGLEWAAYAGGMSLENLRRVLQWGLLSESQITTPHLYSVEYGGGKNL